MSQRMLWAVLAVAVAASGPALAREPFEDAFFVRHGGVAADMLKTRADCSNAALNIGSTAAAYSDPEYGALSAMSHELDADALHDGGLRKRLFRAVFVDCMKRQGWTSLDPTPEEARQISRASLRRPEALDAWLKAHEPPMAATVAASSPPAAPAPPAMTAAPAARAALR